MVEGQIFSGQPVKNYIRTYNSIPKLRTRQGDDCATNYLLIPFSLDNYNMIAIYLSKQEPLDADSKAIQETNVPGNLDSADNTILFFIIEEVKDTFLDLFQGAVKVL